LVRIIKILLSKYPDFIKNILLNPKFVYLKMILSPFIFLFKLIKLITKKTEEEAPVVTEEHLSNSATAEEIVEIEGKNVKVPSFMKNKISLE